MSRAGVGVMQRVQPWIGPVAPRQVPALPRPRRWTAAVKLAAPLRSPGPHPPTSGALRVIVHSIAPGDGVDGPGSRTWQKGDKCSLWRREGAWGMHMCVHPHALCSKLACHGSTPAVLQRQGVRTCSG